MKKKEHTRFNIVLYQPEIPTNTGNIGRVCVASNCHLHLIGPLGFSIDEKQVRRAGLDYWEHLTYTYYQNEEEFFAQNPIEKMIFMTTKSDQVIYDHPFKRGDWIVFGPETRGLPQDLWKAHAQRAYKIPMIGPTRSLNLANSVSIVAFEGLRQLRSSC